MNKGLLYWIKNTLYSIKHKDFILLNICYAWFIEEIIFRVKILFSDIYYKTTNKRTFDKIRNRKFKYYHKITKPKNLVSIDNIHFQINKIAINELRTIVINKSYIFISPSNGIVLNQFRISPQSIHKIGGDRAREVFSYYPHLIYNNLYRSVLNNELLSLSVEKKYLWVHNWFNYYHWITETLFRIWIAKDILKDYIIILPENLKQYSFVIQSLNLIPDATIQYVPTQYSILKTENISLIEQKPYCEEYDPILIKQFVQYIKKSIKISDNNKGIEKIYISRKQAGRRTLSNEEEVIEVFRNHGYNVLTTENLSFIEQIQIFCKAKIIASVHGAGLANMMWMENGTKVLEMHREILNPGNHHSFVYYTLASSLKLDYYYLWCQNGSNSDFFEGNLQIDIEKLKNVLTIMEND